MVTLKGKGSKVPVSTREVLYCGNHHPHHSALQMMFWITAVYSGNNFPPSFVTFSSGLLFCLCWFPPCIFKVLSDKLIAQHPQLTCCCVPLEQLAVSLQGHSWCWLVDFSITDIWEDSLLFGNFLSILKHLSSFSQCWQSVENACLISEGGWVLLLVFSDWRHMQISQAESCMEQHLLS